MAPMTQWLRRELALSPPMDESIDPWGGDGSPPPGKLRLLPPSLFALSLCSCRQHATKTNVILEECPLPATSHRSASPGPGVLRPERASAPPGGLVLPDCRPHPQFATQHIWRGARESAFLTSPQGRLVLLVQGPHLRATSTYEHRAWS